jgi:hypothetical protein
MAENKLPTRERFLQAYANLPLQTRQEVVVVLDGKPITWDVAYFEIKSNTPIGIDILKKLEEFGIF